MDANEIIKKIQNAPKKTPVKVYVKSKRALSFPNAKVYEGYLCSAAGASTGYY